MEDPQIIVLRSKNQSDLHTIGRLIVLSPLGKLLFNSYSLERGGGGNKKGFNRILAETYDLVYEYSNKFKQNLWEIKGTGDRSEMKIHSANYWKQLNGCTALGDKLADINNDGYLDITSSKNTMAKFHKVLKPYEGKTLKITYVDAV